jgi:hypothetical protein
MATVKMEMAISSSQNAIILKQKKRRHQQHEKLAALPHKALSPQLALPSYLKQPKLKPQVNKKHLESKTVSNTTFAPLSPRKHPVPHHR